MNDKQLGRVLGRLAEGLVPAEMDLWSAIQVRFGKSKRHSQKGDPSMNIHNTQNRRLRLASAFMLALLLVTALFSVTPQGRALGQQIMQFFNRAPSDQLPRSYLTTPYPTIDYNDPNNGPFYEMHGSLSDAQAQAGFHIPAPTYLLQTLSFTGALFDTKLKIARIFYGYSPLYTNGLLINEEQYTTNDNCELCGVIGASAPVETVQIGTASGEYVEGDWHLSDNGPVWEQNSYMKTLRWTANGIAFELKYIGPEGSMSKEDLVAIAESMK